MAIWYVALTAGHPFHDALSMWSIGVRWSTRRRRSPTRSRRDRATARYAWARRAANMWTTGHGPPSGSCRHPGLRNRI